LKRDKVLMLIEAALCIALAVMLAAGAIGIYRTGVAAREEDPLAPVYTREKAAEALRPAVPVFLLAAGAAAACRVLGVRSEKRGGDAELPRDPAVARAVTPAPAALRRVLLALAALLIIAGIAGGGMDAVVNKAIRICTECVGLG